MFPVSSACVLDRSESPKVGTETQTLPGHIPSHATSLPQSLNLPLGADNAIDVYVPLYTRPEASTSVKSAWISFTEQLLERRDEPYINAALTAFSLQGLALDYPLLGHLQLEAHQAYGHALRLMNSQLANPDHYISDACMVTVMIFAMYGFRCQDDDSALYFHAHCDGLVRMMKLRGESLAESEQSWRTFRALQDRVFLSYLIRGEEPPFNQAEHPWWFEPHRVFGGPEQEIRPPTDTLCWDMLQGIGFRIPAVANRASVLDVAGEEADILAIEILNEALAIRSSLFEWFESLPPECHTPKIKPVENEDILAQLYPTVQLATCVCWFWSYHIIILQLLGRCLQRSSVASRLAGKMRLAHIQEAVAGMTICVEEICGVIALLRRSGPVLFECASPTDMDISVGIWYLIQPVLVSLAVRDISDSRRRWLVKKLENYCGQPFKRSFEEVDIENLTWGDFTRDILDELWC